MLRDRLHRFPIGYSEVAYKNKKYGVTRTDYNLGKSIKLYAEELGGNDFISLNYYSTAKGECLKPCEMPEQKVIAFLMDFVNLTSHEK
ncbi:MAG TPA: peptide methionine sulfoxide reductase [Pricia antarctica]|uniref:Peptide methionine sulfoxide reductase n=2 Tax=root TaxID=1 RepID=A0A831VQ84_9FLAO|nr:peptide methionine sulfoxide reductase [Pricia antarctica]